MFIESVLIEELRGKGFTETGARLAVKNFLASLEFAHLAERVVLPMGVTVWVTDEDRDEVQAKRYRKEMKSRD